MCICLQETHLKERKMKWLKKVFRGDIFHAPSQTRAKGIMTGIAEDSPCETNMVQIDERGRYVILKGNWIIGVYAPHVCQAQFWKEIFEMVSKIGVMEMGVLGDFNATMCNRVDRSNNSKSLELPKLFKDYMELFQLVGLESKKPVQTRLLFFPLNPIYLILG